VNLHDAKEKRIRTQDTLIARSGNKIKNKAKNKVKNTKQENQTKNKGKKEWKQR
jgi:hypothetical protein